MRTKKIKKDPNSGKTISGKSDSGKTIPDVSNAGKSNPDMTISGKGDSGKGDSGKELNLLRRALEEAERARFEKGLDEAQREELERASVVLRVRERALINEIGVEIAAQIKESGESLEELAKSIRHRSARMSRTAKNTDAVTKALEKVVEAVILLKRLR